MLLLKAWASSHIQRYSCFPRAMKNKNDDAFMPHRIPLYTARPLLLPKSLNILRSVKLNQVLTRETELRLYYSDHVYRQQVYLHLLWLCARTLCECRWSAVGPLWTPARCPFWVASQLVTSINGCFHLSFRLKWLHLPHCDRVCHPWIGASGPVCCCFRQTHPLCCS